jgi:hypothetical protein
MSDTPKKTAETAGNAEARIVDLFPGANAAVFEMPLAAAQAYASALSEMGNEIARFVAMRVECDCGAGRAMAECRKPSDITALQQNWWRQAMEDYSAEAAKLAQVAMRTTAQGWLPPFVGAAGAAADARKRAA